MEIRREKSQPCLLKPIKVEIFSSFLKFAEVLEKSSYFVKSSLADFQQLLISKRKRSLEQRQLTMSKLTFFLMLVVVAYYVQVQGQQVPQTCPANG